MVGRQNRGCAEHTACIKNVVCSTRPVNLSGSSMGTMVPLDLLDFQHAAHGRGEHA